MSEQTKPSRASSPWIRVEDELPPWGVTVYVSDGELVWKDECQRIPRTVAEFYWSVADCAGEKARRTPTHWQPITLPEPPKEGR